MSIPFFDDVDIDLLVGKLKRIRKRKTRVATLINIISD